MAGQGLNNRAEAAVGDPVAAADLLNGCVRDLLADNIGVWRWHIATDRVTVEPGMCALLGLDVDEPPARLDDWFELVCAADRSTLAAAFRAVPTIGADRHDWPDHALRHADGSHRWVSARSMVSRDHTGQPDQVVTVCLDITGRQQEAEALRESARRYRALFHEAAESMIVADARTGEIVEFNERTHTLLGYGREEFQHLRISDFDCVEADPEIVARHVLTIRDKGFDVFETKHLTKNGQALDMLISARRVTIAGRQVIASTWRDISDRKRAEETLEWQVAVNSALAELSEALVRDTSLDEVADLVLDCGKRLTGSVIGYVGYIEPGTGYLVSTTLTKEVWQTCDVPAKDIVFKEFRGLWGWVLTNRKSLLTNSPDDDPRSGGVPLGHVPIRRFVSAPAMVGGELVGQVALSNSPRDYTERDLEVVRRLAALYALAVQRSRAEEELTSHREHLEELVEQRTVELEESRRKVRQAERLASIGTLAAGIAHEINNPLGAILLATHLAQNVHGPSREAERDELIQSIDRDVRRCGRIVKSVLQFAREERSEKHACDLGELMRRCRDTVARRPGIPDVRIDVSCAADLPPVKINPTQIEQALINMIENSIDAGATLVQLAASRRPDPPKALVTVQDDGHGMTETEAQHAFDPFYTNRKDHGGTGLGLSIAHGIINGHDGSIDVRSDKGEGTTISFDLPFDGNMETREHAPDGQGGGVVSYQLSAVSRPQPSPAES